MESTTKDPRALARRARPPTPSGGSRHLVRNEVPVELVLEGAHRKLRLAPLATQLLEANEFKDFDEQKLVSTPFVHHTKIGRAHVGLNRFAVLVGSVASIGLLSAVRGRDGWLPAWAGLVCTLAAGVVGFHFFRSEAKRVGEWLVELTNWLRDKAALLLVLLIGFGLPAGALVVTTGVLDELRSDIGAVLEPGTSTVVVLRLLQVLFLGVAITFPALLYFLFDRQRAATLRTRFEFNIFRLDERVTYRSDVEALYGRQMAEVFGRTPADGAGRHPHSRHRSPMVVTTLVLAVGWIVALVNLDVITVSTLAGASGDPKLTSLFDPEGHVLAFGFLGAYFFSINTVLRSYVRGDLQPKAYSQITGRVLLVAVLTSLIALSEWGSNQAAIGVAFFAGVVPDTVLHWLWEGVRKLRLHRSDGETGSTAASPAGTPSSSNRDPILETQPLTELDGIDLYDRARLASEGVTNIEALAHGSLSDLLLHTRIPAGRLIDWVDQAVLYSHTALRYPDRRALFDALRSMGVRTATDLLEITNEERRPAGRTNLISALAATHPGLLSTEQLDMLLAAISDAEWMSHLCRWRIWKAPTYDSIDLRPASPPASNGVTNGDHVQHAAVLTAPWPKPRSNYPN
jgi:hypothetical protein